MNRKNSTEKIIHNFRAIRRLVSSGNRTAQKEYGVTMAQASLLLLLLHEGKMTMGDIAKDLGISKGAVTQLLNSLIEKELLEKVQDDQDKRIFYISLSKKGAKHFKHVKKHGGKKALKLFDILTDEEIIQFEIITSKLAQEFNKSTDDCLVQASTRKQKDNKKC